MGVAARARAAAAVAMEMVAVVGVAVEEATALVTAGTQVADQTATALDTAAEAMVRVVTVKEVAETAARQRKAK